MRAGGPKLLASGRKVSELLDPNCPGGAAVAPNSRRPRPTFPPACAAIVLLLLANTECSAFSRDCFHGLTAIIACTSLGSSATHSLSRTVSNCVMPWSVKNCSTVIPQEAALLLQLAGDEKCRMLWSLEDEGAKLSDASSLVVGRPRRVLLLLLFVESAVVVTFPIVSPCALTTTTRLLEGGGGEVEGRVVVCFASSDSTSCCLR